MPRGASLYNTAYRTYADAPVILSPDRPHRILYFCRKLRRIWLAGRGLVSREELLAEVVRALEERGAVVLVTPNRPSECYYYVSIVSREPVDAFRVRGLVVPATSLRGGWNSRLGIYVERVNRRRKPGMILATEARAGYCHRCRLIIDPSTLPLPGR